MNKYDVYKHPILGYEAIKQGFSWPGFFFTWIWAFVKKLWVHGVVLMIAVLIANSLGFALLEGNAFGVFLGLILLIIPATIAGVIGNKWRVNSMLARGYKLECTVMAATSEAALAEATKPAEERMRDPTEGAQSNESDVIREKSVFNKAECWKKYPGKEIHYLIICVLLGVILSATFYYSFPHVELNDIINIMEESEGKQLTLSEKQLYQRLLWMAHLMNSIMIAAFPYLLWIGYRLLRFVFCRFDQF